MIAFLIWLVALWNAPVLTIILTILMLLIDD